jgi:hypothetical protein
VLPNGSQRTGDNGFPQVTKPISFVVIAVLYPFVIVGLMALVDILFRDAPFEGEALLSVFILGNVFMNALLIYYRHKNRDRWIKSEAAKWLHRRSQSRRSRKATRWLLWLPSIFAVWVLVFLPLATHVTHPSSHYLPGYRIPIPWTWTAVPVCFGDTCWVDAVISSKGRGRFGVTPFWPTTQLSMVSFGTTKSDYAASDWKPEGVSHLTEVDLNIGNMPFRCWQYVSQNDLFNRQLIGLGADVMAWNVVCSNGTFYASFFGRAEDLPAFYNVLQRTSRTGV